MINSVELGAAGEGISSEETIAGLQLGLAANFEGLRASRGNVRVYLLEHGFTDKDLVNLFGLVRDCLNRHSIEGDWWSSRSLPLLVAATEVG